MYNELLKLLKKLLIKYKVFSWHSHKWLEKMSRFDHWLELDHLLLPGGVVVEVGVVAVEDSGGGDREEVHTVPGVILVLVGAGHGHVLTGHLAGGEGLHSLNSTPTSSKQPTKLVTISYYINIILSTKVIKT